MINLAVAERAPSHPAEMSRDTLMTLLDELESLLLRIRPNQYTSRVAAHATAVGFQVARALSRIASLLAGTETGTIRYASGSGDIARDPVAALKHVRTLRGACECWPLVPLSTVVRVEHATGIEDEIDRGWSTLAGEAAFVISETIDAQRSIVGILKTLGAAVPERFGGTPLPRLTARASAPPVWALWTKLDEIASLLLELPAEIYMAAVEGHVSGSVGAHVRHCLDHISALLSAEPSATLSYDRRRRGTAAESDPGAALEQILRLKAALERSSSRSLDEPIRVMSQIDASGASIAGWSTFGRELAFVLSHTIHHQATMAAVLALHGVTAPDHFGYAPSTPRH